MKAAGILTGEFTLLLLNNKSSKGPILPEKEGRDLFYSGRTAVLFPYAFILIFTFMLSACASTEDVGKMQYKIGELDKKVQELGRRSQVIEAEIPKSEKQISDKIEGTKDSQEATARAVSNLFMKVQAFSGDIQQLTGRMDESQHLYEKNLKDEAEKREILAAEVSGLEVLLEDLKSKLADIKAGMDEMRLEQALLSEKAVGFESRRIAQKKDITKKIETAEIAATAATSETGEIAAIAEIGKTTDTSVIAETFKTPETSETNVPEAVVKVNVKDVYDSAMKLFKEGTYKSARTGFMSVLKGFKENEYSDNARFWIGESYFKEKKYEDAVLAYEELLRNNPDSDKVPSAKLKQGLAFYELKDPETGDIILKGLIESFPDSQEAAAARKKLGVAPVTSKEGE